MDEYDAEKEEADVMDFGILTHSALEVLIEYSAVNPDEGEIYKLLCDRLAKKINYRYGSKPSLAILQQKASIERRLKRVAQIHSNELSDGWEIKEVEKKFYMDTRGSTDPAEAKEGTVRRKYAESKGRNAVHGSDSDENANIECNFHFGVAELV